MMLDAKTIVVWGCSYVTTTDAGSEAPVPNASVVSIMAHGLRMLTDTRKAAHPALNVHTLMLCSIIARRARPCRDPTWVTAQEVGEAAAWLFTPAGQLAAGSTLSLNPKASVLAAE